MTDHVRGPEAEITDPIGADVDRIRLSRRGLDVNRFGVEAQPWTRMALRARAFTSPI